MGEIVAMDGLEETFVENFLAISQSGSVIMEHYNKYEKKEIAFSEFKSIESKKNQ